MAKSKALLIGLGVAWCIALPAILLLVDDDSGTGRTVLALESEGSVSKGNWRTDDEAIPCSEDPMCGYGGVSLDPKAYEDASPLALINENYKEGQLNPYPGPRNFGPDSPYAWLPEEAADDVPARSMWPDYPAKKTTGESAQINGASTMAMYPAKGQVLRMLNRQRQVVSTPEGEELLVW